MEFTNERLRFKGSDALDFYSTDSLGREHLEYEQNEPFNLHYGLIRVGLPILVDLTKGKLPSIEDGNIPENYRCQRATHYVGNY